MGYFDYHTSSHSVLKGIYMSVNGERGRFVADYPKTTSSYHKIVFKFDSDLTAAKNDKLSKIKRRELNLLDNSEKELVTDILNNNQYYEYLKGKPQSMIDGWPDFIICGKGDNLGFSFFFDGIENNKAMYKNP